MSHSTQDHQSLCLYLTLISHFYMFYRWDHLYHIHSLLNKMRRKAPNNNIIKKKESNLQTTLRSKHCLHQCSHVCNNLQFLKHFIPPENLLYIIYSHNSCKNNTPVEFLSWTKPSWGFADSLDSFAVPQREYSIIYFFCVHTQESRLTYTCIQITWASMKPTLKLRKLTYLREQSP